MKNLLVLLVGFFLAIPVLAIDQQDSPKQQNQIDQSDEQFDQDFDQDFNSDDSTSEDGEEALTRPWPYPGPHHPYPGPGHHPWPYPGPHHPYPGPHHPYPGSHYKHWTCTARDAGYEEHWNGHTATGLDYWNTRNRAEWECRHFHGRCYVNCYQH